ncbi:MAG: hypothetical protein LJE84_03635 [Gammaproteobacteria bacterium]|nr:hypothetical protein [Gammaproteobacteria bacterium]
MRPVARYLAIATAAGLLVAVAGPSLWKYQQRSAMVEPGPVDSELQSQEAKNQLQLPASAADREEAAPVAGVRLEPGVNLQQRAFQAARRFRSYYRANVRERRDWCAEKGVDIGPFVEAFIYEHRKELVRAGMLLRRYAADEEQLDQQGQDRLRDAIATEMRDVAQANGISQKQACQLVADRGARLAAQVQFARVQPETFSALMEQ